MVGTPLSAVISKDLSHRNTAGNLARETGGVADIYGAIRGEKIFGFWFQYKGAGLSMGTDSNPRFMWQMAGEERGLELAGKSGKEGNDILDHYL